VIDGYFHVQLGSYKYRLANNALDAHYTAKLIALNASNAQVTQSSEQQIDLNPDSLVWESTDWSGGEGSKKWNPQKSNMYDISYKVDALHTPGSVRLAKDVEASGISQTGSLVKANDKLIFFSQQDDTYSIYSGNLANTTWTSNDTSALGDSDFFATRGDGDGKYAYIPQGNSDDIYRFTISSDATAAATETLWQNSDQTSVFDRPLVKIGNKLITVHLESDTITVLEYNVASGALQGKTTIFQTNVATLDSFSNQGIITKGDDEAFVCVRTKQGESVLFRIRPTSALGTGYGVEVGRLAGFNVDCIWYAAGVLFMGGTSTTTGVGERVIYYAKGTELGSFGLLRQDESFTDGKMILSTDATRMDRTFFLAPTGSAADTWTLFTIDLLTGAIFGGPEFTSVDEPSSLVDFLGRIFLTQDKTASSSGSYRTAGTYATSGELFSSVHDFQLADEKTLLSIRLSTEPLPANTSVQLYYQKDQNGTWTSAGTAYSTTGGTNNTYEISTNSASVKFNNLQLKIKLTTSDTSTTPVVRAVSVRATPSETVKEWDLVLDVTDADANAQGTAYTGATLINNIQSSADAENVIEFRNGYESSSSGSYDTYQAIIKQYGIQLTSPGEGTVVVRLRQVH